MKWQDQIYQRFRKQTFWRVVGVQVCGVTNVLYLDVNRGIDAPTGFSAAGRMWEEVNR